MNIFKLLYALIQVARIFVLALCFKFINLSFQIFAFILKCLLVSLLIFF